MVVIIYNNIMDLQNEYWPQSLCLLGQLSISVVGIIRIRDNRDQFPVRQLGPASTVVCILCFFFSNLISLLGRVIMENNERKSICLPHQSWLLFVFSILYNIMRELPFTLFVIKILRVSLSFWPTFNKLNVQKIPKIFVSFLKSETYFVFACVVYVSMLNLLLIGIYGTAQEKSSLYYEYFCPKLQSTVFEQIITGIRFISLVFVFYLSLWTYQELDFKRFLILIFLSSSLSIIPHLVLVFRNQKEINIAYQRYSIYYTSYLISLFNSCIILYYSGVNKELNQPAMQGVLQSWQAFHNLKLGMNVLFSFAQYKDNHSEMNKYNFRCLESYDYLDQILRERALNSSFEIQNEFEVIEKILQRNQYLKFKLGQPNTLEFRQKCNNGTLTIENIKRMERVLSNYCETMIFADWKKTKSYKFLKDEFINNGDINEKLGLFGIPVS